MILACSVSYSRFFIALFKSEVFLNVPLVFSGKRDMAISACKTARCFSILLNTFIVPNTWLTTLLSAFLSLSRRTSSRSAFRSISAPNSSCPKNCLNYLATIAYSSSLSTTDELTAYYTSLNYLYLNLSIYSFNSSPFSLIYSITSSNLLLI